MQNIKEMPMFRPDADTATMGDDGGSWQSFTQ